MPVIDIPDVGTVEFPDDMAAADIEREASAAYAQAHPSLQPKFATDGWRRQPGLDAAYNPPPRDPAADTYEAQLQQVGVSPAEAARVQQGADLRAEQAFPGLPDSGLKYAGAKAHQAFARGWAGLSESLNTAGGVLLEKISRSPALAVFRGPAMQGGALEKVGEAGEYLQDTGKEVRKTGRDLSLIEQATPGGKVAKAAAAVIGAAPSLVPSLATAPVGGLPILMAGLQTYGSVVGDAEEGYRRQGLDATEAREKAQSTAAIPALGTALLTLGFNRFGAAGLEKWAENMGSTAGRKAVNELAREFGGEFSEEGLDQFWQGVVERHTYNPDKSWKQIVDEALAAAVAGGTLALSAKSLHVLDARVREMQELKAADQQFAAASEQFAADVANLVSLPPTSGMRAKAEPPPTAPPQRAGLETPPAEVTAPEPEILNPISPAPPSGLPPAGQPGPVPGDAGAGASAPAVNASPVVPGRTTTINGANDAKIPAVYAWVPGGDIQASHAGEMFSINPAYAPLKNTRRYHEDQAERDKVLHGAQNFQPDSYTTNVKGAAEGPVMVSQGSDGVMRVLGGNGRFQMIQRLSPEQRAQFGAVQDSEAATFGLPARPSPDHLLVRLLPGSDLTSPEGIDAANRTIDLLNPSPGLVESTASMARNDAAKVPFEELAIIRPDSTPGIMRDWMRGLIEAGVLDRNTRTQIAANDSQIGDYVQRLLVQAAYHSDVVNDFRHDPKTAATTRALIDTGIPLLTALRAKGQTATANAFTELVTRTADYQRSNPGAKLDTVLEQIHAQTEGFETADGELARRLALALSSQVERLPANKRGEEKIDPDETAINFRNFFDGLSRSVKQAEATPDLFGNTRTPTEAIADFIRSKVGDEPMVLKEEGGGYRATPDPRVVLLNKLEAARQKRKLTSAEEQQRAALELALGQSFMAFHTEHAAQQRDLKAEQDRQEMLARQGKRLVAGAIETQRDFFAPAPDQPTLFEPGQLGIDTKAIEAYLRDAGVENPARVADGISRAISSVATPEMARRLEEGIQGELFGPKAARPAGAAPGGSGVSGDPAEVATRAALNPFATAADFARAFAYGDTISSIVVKLLTRQIPNFDLRGQTIRTHLDYVLASRALRSPYFETYKAVLLNKDGVVVESAILSAGTVNATTVGISDLVQFMQEAKRKHAGPLRLITGHNHPGGYADPSAPDIKLSPRFTEAARAEGIEHMDDIVTNGEEFYSFKENRIVQIPRKLVEHPEWERVPRRELRLVASGEAFTQLRAELRTASPSHHHVIYTNTRQRVTAVRRVPTGLSHEELFNTIASGAAEHGAPNVFIDFAPVFGEDLAASVARRFKSKLASWSISMSDASSSTVPSMWATGLLYDAPDSAAEANNAEALAEPQQPYTSSAVTISFPKTPALKGPVPPPMALAMGGMQHVHPVEMPELVRLATELMGHQPGLKRFPKAAGMFYGGPGSSVAIKLDPRIFVNSADAAKVLAHEIGHLVDYLPDHTLKRGNMLGRLRTMREFLKNTFGSGVTNKELRAELVALTQYWHPYDPATVPASYKAYRESSSELYADALSVLLNSPGLLQQMAPKFYREFWKHLDVKPDVKQTLFDLQDLLNKGKVPVLEQRKADRETMFTKGDAILQRKAAEREARRKSWSGYWLELKQTIFDKFEPIVQKARAAEAAGTTFPPRQDPRNILEEGAMTDNTNARMVSRLFDQVIKPIEDAGITVMQLGDYLLLRRIHAGDRSTLANPLGTTPETARLDLLKMRLDLGMNAMTRLERAVARFHDIVFEAVEEAVAVGSYSKEVFESRIKPNKDVYAAFAVLDYLEDYVPAGVKNQVGTLKEVANPFTATVLKTISLNNLNSIQRSKNATRDLLRNHFPTEIEAAQGRFIAPGFTDQPPPKADRGLLQVLENGRPAYYYVDPFIASAFERLSPNGLARTLRVLDFVFRKGFYRLYITYSPSFLIFNPVRDFNRAWKNLPAGTTRFQLARAYADSFSSAIAHVRGLPNGLATEMIANYAIGIPETSLVSSHRDDPFGDLLRRFRMMPEAEKSAFWDNSFVKPVRALGRAMEFFGQLQEALPKMAAYQIAKKEFGMSPSEAAGFVRNYAGTPNVFKKGTQVQVIRPIIPFFNVFAQGWRADLRRMNPKSQSGWLWKWASSDGLWAILTGLGAAGLLGAGLKELLSGMSEYDKTNYNLIPIGYSEGGDFGKKVQYLRVPRDESSRLLSGLTYKLTRLLAGDAPEQFSDLLDFGAGQTPGVNPAITIPAKWLDAATGHNPADPFRGRPIIPQTEFTAGGAHVLKPMLLWTVDQTGAGNFVRWNAEANTTTEMVLSAIPGLKSLLKTSDYGYREEQKATNEKLEQKRAEHLLALPESVQSLRREYEGMKRIPATVRTAPQTARYEHLNVWHNTIFRPMDEAITLAEDAGQKEFAAAQRKNLDETSKGFEKASGK